MVRNPAFDPEGGAVVGLPRGRCRKTPTRARGGALRAGAGDTALEARGLSNRRIAASLHLTEDTAKRHLANTYMEVGLRGEPVRNAPSEDWTWCARSPSTATGTGKRSPKTPADDGSADRLA